jgi:hypothetical protein
VVARKVYSRKLCPCTAYLYFFSMARTKNQHENGRTRCSHPINGDVHIPLSYMGTPLTDFLPTCLDIYIYRDTYIEIIIIIISLHSLYILFKISNTYNRDLLNIQKQFINFLKWNYFLVFNTWLLCDLESRNILGKRRDRPINETFFYEMRKYCTLTVLRIVAFHHL